MRGCCGCDSALPSTADDAFAEGEAVVVANFGKILFCVILTTDPLPLIDLMTENVFVVLDDDELIVTVGELLVIGDTVRSTKMPPGAPPVPDVVAIVPVTILPIVLVAVFSAATIFAAVVSILALRSLQRLTVARTFSKLV